MSSSRHAPTPSRASTARQAHLAPLDPGSASCVRSPSSHRVISVREDRDHLEAAVQRGLGQQADQAGAADLIARINELTTSSGSAKRP